MSMGNLVMDEIFLQRATDIELRLEAEGMFLTAQAIRQVVKIYVVEHSRHIEKETSRSLPLIRTDLTLR